MKHQNKYSIILFFLLLPFISNAATSSFWLTLDSASKQLGPVQTKFHSEFRFNDFEEFSYFRLSPKFYWKLNDTWKLGTHPVIEGTNKNSNWANTYRFDIELNPKSIKLSEGGTYSMRNRWEFRWKENKGHELFHRIRHFSKLTWKFSDSNRWFKSYSIGDELFYELDKSKVTMNRFYPIALGLKNDSAISSTIYYMYQTKRSGVSSTWNTRHIIGYKGKF